VKRLIVATIAAAVLCGAPAIAADMPTKARVYAPTTFNWTGWYVGVNAGGAWGRTSVDSTFLPVTVNDTLIAASDSPTLTPNGFTAGGQFGYNYQVSQWLIGLEADFGYYGLRNSQTATGALVGGGTFAVMPSINTNWLGTVRPRLGYVWDRTLFYVTGGLAMTDVHFADSYIDTVGDAGSSSASKVKTGWAFGGGLEYAMWNNWSVKAEYLHLDFGSVSSSNIVIGCGPICSQTHTANLTSDVVRLGLNYQLGR